MNKIRLLKLVGPGARLACCTLAYGGSHTALLMTETTLSLLRSVRLVKPATRFGQEVDPHDLPSDSDTEVSNHGGLSGYF
jgi:hypothetical protein